MTHDELVNKFKKFEIKYRGNDIKEVRIEGVVTISNAVQITKEYAEQYAEEQITKLLSDPERLANNLMGM